ncbi:unnamed protein product, partial [Symbiodinium microadriaticum]
MVLLAPVPDYEGLVNGCLCSKTSVHFSKPSNEWPNIVIFTGGARYQFDAQNRDRRRIHHKDDWVDAFPAAVRDFNVRLHDLRELSDPNEGALSACTGRHTGILEGILNSPAGRYILTSCFKDIEMAVDGHKPLVVLPFCTSNRHRSVAMGTLISAGLYVLGMDHFLGHLHANASWPDMKCGGKCARCRSHFDHAEATQLVLAHLDSQVTRYATHPADRQRSRGGGGTIPDPAAHSAPPPVTRGTSIGPPVPKGPPASLRSGGSGGDGGGGPPNGPPAPRVVPPRDDLDWRDRAIRAEALLERVQVELQESKDRNTALELRIQDLETQNRNLYGQACVAEQWNEWFQDQQEKGFLAGYHQETPQHTPRSTPRGTPGRGSRGRSSRGRSGSEDDGGYISRSSTPQRSRSGFLRRGKMGDRSTTPSGKGRSPTPTPQGGAAGSSTDRTDHSTAFGDGHDAMESITEETLNANR